MKNIHIKKIMYSVVGGMLGLALFITLSNDATGQNVSVINTDGGVANIAQLQLSREKEDRDVPGTTASSVLTDEQAGFRMVGTSMFSDLVSFGQARFDRLAVGYDSEFNYDQGDVELQVDGKITIKELAHAGPDPIPACVNDFGVIQACGAGTFSCTNVPTNATLCPGDNTGLVQNVDSTLVSSCSVPVDSPYCEYTCNSGYSLSGGVCVADPTPVNGLCDETVNNGCTTGTLNDIPDGMSDYLWECTGSNGGTTDSCSMTIPGPLVNGQCGASDGGVFSSPPTIKLCALGGGIPSAVTTNPGTYTWTCYGSGGGTDDSCSATISIGSGSSYDCALDGNWHYNSGNSPCLPINYNDGFMYVQGTSTCASSAPAHSTCSDF